jgi:hypothetical protein
MVRPPQRMMTKPPMKRHNDEILFASSRARG